MVISKSQMKCEKKGELEQTSVNCWTLMSEDELLRKVFCSSYQCRLCSIFWVSCLLHTGALEDAWAGFCFTLQFSGWSLNAPVDVSKPLELPLWQGLGPSKGWGRCLGFGKCWSHLRKKLSSLGNESLHVQCLGFVGFALDIQFWIWVLWLVKFFLWCALTVCYLPYWDNQESGVPWKMSLGNKLSLFLWHTFKTRKPWCLYPSQF